MDGGCISVWVEKRLTLIERRLLQKYEYFLMDYGVGYSFDYEYRQPEFDTRCERNQIKSKLGFIPEQDIFICGLADPMFRAAEAIMKYFNGYYMIYVHDDIAKYLNYRCIAIKKRNKWGIPKYAYHLVDWQFIANYYNQLDTKKVRTVYDIERFKNNEFERLWKAKPNYGVGFN